MKSGVFGIPTPIRDFYLTVARGLMSPSATETNAK